MLRLLSLVFRLLLAVICIEAAGPAEVLPHRQDRPPNAPRSPEEALRHMSVPEGFSVELVASEPEIVNPIAMTFDDRGRIWITESIEYPRKRAGPGRDRVKILEDTNGDGRRDRVSTFASDLNIPTGVAVGYGGVWVLNAPDLLFFREENGKAISREVIISGFGRTDTHELPNSLTWGPDGWLYGLNGVFNESRVVSRGKEFKFNCAMWRLHPRTHEFQIVCEGTSNPYGIAWNFDGSAIVEACHWANDHLFHFVETGQYQRQAGAFPPYTMKIGSITDHGHQKTAYCGIALFDSDSYPEKYRGRIYVGNIHGGCVNVDRLQRDGATYLAKAEPDFLSADDAWFMPVSLKVGPDGCLYVLDWYDRYHCSQDAARDPEGVDRLKGRLYRVRYKNSARASPFNLATESDAQLVERLSSPNIFFRESAQRILTERLAAAAEPAGKDATKGLRRTLEELTLNRAFSQTARLQALWTLIGSGELGKEFHLKLLSDSDPALRAWGVRAAGNFQGVSEAIREKIVELARDGSPDVQLQVAIAARKLSGVNPLAIITEVLANCGLDKVIPAIGWNNLHPLLEKEGGRFVELMRQFDFARAPALANLAPLAVDRMLGAKEVNAKAIGSLVGLLTKGDAERAKEAFAIISRRAGELPTKTLAALRDELRPFSKAILTTPSHPLYVAAQLLAARLQLQAVDGSVVRSRFESQAEPENVRLQALESMIAFKDDSLLLQGLSSVLTSNPPGFVRRVMNLLGRVEDAKLGEIVLAQYGKLDPELQPLAIELLLQRESWARQLLKAVREKRVPAVLNANHLRKILESNDREAIWEVEKVFGKVRDERNPGREKVVADMASYLRAHPGNPGAGREVFRKSCSQCHTIYGQGGNVGPDITSNGRASFEQLLSNVFDPSLVIAPAYQVTTVVTLDGRNLTGLVTEESERRVTLKVPGEGVETIPRSNIKYTHLSKLSMMPEGIETMLDGKEISDLFAFLALDRPPEDEHTKPIPGATEPTGLSPNRTGRTNEGASLRLERVESKLIVRARSENGDHEIDLVTFVMDPAQRPYLHPVRDASGAQVLTQDRPADHPWQHGIFTGFHGLVNGHEYWMENDGHQHFVRLVRLQDTPHRVSWRALTQFVEPGGRIPLEEEDAITVHAPEGDLYLIDFELLLRARETDVVFGKAAVGGLAVRMPWDESNPRQTHLNSDGQRGRACEKQRAAWCNVERPFGENIFGITVFDHPGNPNHPPAWRVDDQGLIDPSVTSVTGWTLPAKSSREFRYRLLVYKGSAARESLQRTFEDFGKTTLSGLNSP